MWSGCRESRDSGSGSFPEGEAAAVVVLVFDVNAYASPPISGSYTCAHALGADVGYTF